MLNLNAYLCKIIINQCFPSMPHQKPKKPEFDYNSNHSFFLSVTSLVRIIRFLINLFPFIYNAVGVVQKIC